MTQKMSLMNLRKIARELLLISEWVAAHQKRIVTHSTHVQAYRSQMELVPNKIRCQNLSDPLAMACETEGYEVEPRAQAYKLITCQG